MPDRVASRFLGRLLGESLKFRLLNQCSSPLLDTRSTETGFPPVSIYASMFKFFVNLQCFKFSFKQLGDCSKFSLSRINFLLYRLSLISWRWLSKRFLRTVERWPEATDFKRLQPKCCCIFETDCRFEVFVFFVTDMCSLFRLLRLCAQLVRTPAVICQWKDEVSAVRSFWIFPPFRINFSLSALFESEAPRYNPPRFFRVSLPPGALGTIFSTLLVYFLARRSRCCILFLLFFHNSSLITVIFFHSLQPLFAVSFLLAFPTFRRMLQFV